MSSSAHEPDAWPSTQVVTNTKRIKLSYFGGISHLFLHLVVRYACGVPAVQLGQLTHHRQAECEKLIAGCVTWSADPPQTVRV